MEKMSNRNIFIGLNDFGANMCNTVSKSFENSICFSILDEYFKPDMMNLHNHTYFRQGMMLIDYVYHLNDSDRRKLLEWNNMTRWYGKGGFYNYLSRIDYRMVYEYRKSLISKGYQLDDILAKEITDISDEDVIHIVAPYYERSAMAIGFFLAWDIRELYSSQNKKIRIVAHYVLPDTPVFHRPTVTEKTHNYADFTAFVKELICINNVCNGVFGTGLKTDLNFEIDKRFDSIKYFGDSEKLPFDYVCFFGSNEKLLDDTEKLDRDKLQVEFSKNILDYENTGISCRLPDFREILYKRHPQFSKDGYANLAYLEIVNAAKEKAYLQSPHLDYRWNDMMKKI